MLFRHINMFLYQTGYLKLKTDNFIAFCTTNPTYDEALVKYPQRIFEAELSGEIEIRNGRIFVI